MRLTLQPTPEQASALSDTRAHVSRLMNSLLVQARRQPDTPTEDLLSAHPDATALPHATRRAAAQAAQDARHNTRGGLTGESYWLDARSLRLNPSTGHVTLWTIQGRCTIPTRLGNYQRHLLTTSRVQGGRVTQARNGDWYVNVQLDTPPPPSKVPYFYTTTIVVSFTFLLVWFRTAVTRSAALRWFSTSRARAYAAQTA